MPWATADVRGKAQAFVLAVVAGEVRPGTADELAAAVLSAELVQLALEVQKGGPFATRRALELAALVLDGTRGERADAAL